MLRYSLAMSLLTWTGLRGPAGIAWRDGALDPEEILVLRGPNGCGKSLLLRALADLDPAQGLVALAGVDRVQIQGPKWRRQVRYVHPQAPRLPLSAAEAFAELGGQGPVPREFEGERQHGLLSSGEAQRLALAAALSSESRVLLLDEATSALDPERAKEAEAAVRDRSRAGCAVLWISHDKGLAQRLECEELLLP